METTKNDIENKKADIKKSLGQTLYDLYKWLVCEKMDSGDFDKHVKNIIEETKTKTK